MDGLSLGQAISVAGKVLSWWDPGHCRDFWKRTESLLFQYPMGWTKYLSPAQTLSLFFLFMMLEKTLESPLDCKEIQPVNPKGKQSWIFIFRTDVETEAPIFCPPDAKSQLTGKDPDAGKDWGQDEKGVTEDEMVRWHHWLSGHEFEQALGDEEGQGSLACCSPWGCRVRHDLVTEQDQLQKLW